MATIPFVKPGDLITADLYNALVEKFNRFAGLSVAPGSGLIHMEGPPGRHLLGYAPERPVVARLSGATSPYSWHEVAASVSGGVLTWSNYGVRSGTGDAYEINGLAGLNGKIVELWDTGFDWRFNHVRVAVPIVPCTGGTGQICATVTNNGCGSPLAGATITVKDHTGAVVGTCTTDGTGKCCIAIPFSGTYTVTSDVPGTATLTTTINATCSLTTNNVTFTYATNSLGTLCLTATTCGASGTSNVGGANLSFTGTGSGSATTDGSGTVCTPLSVGSYSGTVTFPSGFSTPVSFTIGACTTTNLVISTVTYWSGTLGGDRDPFTGSCKGCTGTVTLKNNVTGATLASVTTTPVVTDPSNPTHCCTCSFSSSIPETLENTAVKETRTFPGLGTSTQIYPLVCPPGNGGGSFCQSGGAATQLC